jgi:hypothetical protein
MGIQIHNLTSQLLIYDEEGKNVSYIPKTGTVVSGVNGSVVITSGGIEKMNLTTDKITLPVGNGLFQMVGTINGYIESNPTVGFKLPVMTTVERNALVSPETGFIIFNSTDSTGQIFDGTLWQNVY